MQPVPHPLSTRVATPVGEVALVFHDDALCQLTFVDREGPVPATPVARPAVAPGPESPGADRSVHALIAYFDGDLHAIDDVTVRVGGTAFQEAVWKALREIPAGETRTYGDIARHVGRPDAVRAVGTAVGRNPVSIVLPCHRVVPRAGGTGNYGGGADRKRWLLEHEHALR